MNFWQIKVSIKDWAIESDEFKNLKEGDIYPQKVQDKRDEPRNNINDIVFIHNTVKGTNKKYPDGLYLICKIVTNIKINNNKETIDLKVIKNLKDVPKNLEEYGFKELKKYINKQGANGRIYLFKDEDRGNKLYSLIMGSDLPTTHSDKTPREKKPLININGKEEYPRDENIKNHALEDANYQCELDESHISFISQKTTKNYVEGHHLIPVNQHSKFKYDLDVSENIISLCPECHRMLHHAEKRQIRSGLSKLLEQRSDALKEVGLDISLDELVEVY